MEKIILTNKMSDRRVSGSGIIEVIITGDYCLDRRIQQLCQKKEYQNLYGNVLEILRKKDIAITNLECPLTTHVNAIKKIGPVLCARPECVDAIKYAGFDVVTLANNHILDYGGEGLKETMRTCAKAGIKTIGAGSTLTEAAKPLYFDIKGQRIALLNFAEPEFSIARDEKPGANPLDPIGAYYQIREARNHADMVIVIVHCGVEGYHLPTPDMVKLFRFFAASGASAIVGHHSHCSSGYEIHNGVPIFYGLGNFLFDRQKVNDASWHEGYFLKLAIQDAAIIEITLIPYYQSMEQPGLRLMNPNESKVFLEKIKKYSEIIADESSLNKEWHTFCKSVRNRYLASVLGLGIVKRQLLKSGLCTKKFIDNRRNRLLLNLFRCPAHRDVIINILEKEAGD